MSRQMAPPLILDLITKASGYLASKGVDTARLDAELLLGHVLKMERIELYMRFDQPLEPREVDAYRIAIAKRAGRQPVAYITGSKEFYSLKLRVNPNVLIPRPETELLVERVLEWLGQQELEARIIELGTGSGAIAVALAHSLGQVEGARPRIYATDISPEALQVAKANVDDYEVGETVEFLQGNLYDALPSSLVSQVDVIISNPPYIPTDEIKELAPEILQYEPLGALDGGVDGLAFYRRIYAEGQKFLRPGGLVAVEIGHGQGSQVVAIAQNLGYIEPKVYRDYGDKERVVMAIWK
ncbi:MAG: peptide chain release factor N(5)-glutamine methyltransferase [Firmicutes bacterium]|mgnify:CR=1 FL=1|jgi:release factor glutamine methyltransferase|nr:peptide chain release factor N(5)-glutamine methyltransferase [Bacillota bacterium]